MNTLLEINLLLSLVYLGYFLLLRNLTFFQWTRLYFLVGMAASVLYPVLRANQVVQAPAEAIAISLPQLQIPAQNWDWETWLFCALMGISLLYFFRLLLQFGALRNIHKQTRKTRFEEHEYQESYQEIKPFSFLRWIYVHSESHSRRELAQILKHEDVHVRELHTLDVLLAEFCRILCWYNPAVLLLNRAVKDNLEFGVDRKLIHTGIDKVSYQHSLVGIALNKVPHPYPGNEFAFKTLKRRILMMNRNPSHRTRLFTYAVLLPALLIGCAFLNVSCQKETVDSVAKPQSISLISAAKDSSSLVQEQRVVIGRPVTEGRVAGVRLEGEGKIVEGQEIKAITVVEGKPLQVSLSSRDHFRAKSAGGETVVIGRPSTEASVRGTGAITGTSEPILVVGRPIVPQSNIIIRGKGTVNHEDKPLIIVDGLEIENISDLKPDDIQAISVLKGESAEKTYGTKAKNGVIVVTTKPGTRH